jgi:hypothetical protein
MITYKKVVHLGRKKKCESGAILQLLHRQTGLLARGLKLGERCRNSGSSKPDKAPRAIPNQGTRGGSLHTETCRGVTGGDARQPGCAIPGPRLGQTAPQSESSASRPATGRDI